MKTSIFFMGVLLSVFGSASLAQNDYTAVMHRNIAYNDFMRNSISKDRLAVQINPNDAEAQEYLGLALYTNRWRLVAEGLYETPSSAEVQEEAFTHLEKAVMLQPNQVQWQLSLGLFLNKSGRYQSAIPHLQECLHLLTANNPLNPQLGKEKLTKEQLLFLHDPRSGMALFDLGEAYKNIGKRAEARSVWHSIVALCPQRSRDVKLARRYLIKYPATHDH